MEGKDLNVNEENLEEVEEVLDEENLESNNQDEVNEIKDQYLRLQADFQNFKRRKEKEREEAIAYGIEEIVKDILPTLDNFERALKMEEEKEGSFYQGIEMIYNSFLDALKKNDVCPIEALGQEFDPNYHHAVFKEEKEGVEANKVTEELQRGYILKDKVIRPTMVKVSE